jgi:putative sigma-54 modulation protein
MRVSYKGVQKALPPKLQEKLDARFSKLSKLLEKRGEKEAHVVVTSERHLHKAEITLQAHNHELVGLGADADLFTALHTALEKVEKQALKVRTKWREKTRRSPAPSATPAAKPARAVKTTATRNGSHVSRVNHRDGHKPMTLDEALLEMENNRDYVVYRDAEKEGISVLVRRRDGNFDLIES